MTKSASTFPSSIGTFFGSPEPSCPEVEFHADDERRFNFQGHTYTTEWPLADERGWQFFRLTEGTLAQTVIAGAKNRQFDDANHLRFDLSAYAVRSAGVVSRCSTEENGGSRRIPPSANPGNSTIVSARRGVKSVATAEQRPKKFKYGHRFEEIVGVRAKVLYDEYRYRTWTGSPLV